MTLRYWILAARPKTLPAAIAPVVLATSLASALGVFSWLPALLCFAFALLIQIATNFANDYFDHRKGTDSEKRMGPKRAVAEGWISPRAMWRGTLLTLFLAFLVGINLVWFGGWHLLFVGALSIGFSILYTGGPYPLAYLGLGDLFVLIFFGWVAVMYTFFVQAGFHSWDAFHLGTAVGMLSVNLLLVNNYRDYPNDRESNKKTTVVRFGRTYARWQYRLALVLALASTITVAYRQDLPLLGLACLPILPGFVLGSRLKQAKTLEEYEQLLQKTAMILLVYALFAATLLFFS